MKQKHVSWFVCIVLAAGVVAGCSGGARSLAPQDAPAALDLTSPVFVEGAPVPTRHTCDGDDVSPPLNWSGLPQTAKSLALICDDPDGGDWVHWVIYNIPPTADGLAESVPKTETALDGVRQGKNDFRRVGYGGPCPPAGKPHRYFFRLYALDVELGLEPGASRGELLDAIKGHVVAEGRLMGTYQRNK